MKIRKFGARDGYRPGTGYLHWCAGCETTHEFAVEEPFSNGAKWTFNGDFEKPTFSPSMNIRTGPYPYGPGETPRIDVCHYFLRDGQLQFLPDCTHALKGVTVPLPDLPERYRDA